MDDIQKAIAEIEALQLQADNALDLAGRAHDQLSSALTDIGQIGNRLGDLRDLLDSALAAEEG